MLLQVGRGSPVLDAEQTPPSELPPAAAERDPDRRRCWAVRLLGSAVRRNPRSIGSAAVSASHVPLHDTAWLRRLHSPPPRTSGRNVPEHPSAGGSCWCKRFPSDSTALPRPEIAPKTLFAIALCIQQRVPSIVLTLFGDPLGVSTGTLWTFRSCEPYLESIANPRKDDRAEKGSQAPRLEGGGAARDAARPQG